MGRDAGPRTTQLATHSLVCCVGDGRTAGGRLGGGGGARLFVPSIMTEGRTAGGGTGKAVSTIQAGRDHRGSNPSATQSSSEMAFRMSCAFSAVSSCALKRRVLHHRGTWMQGPLWGL